MIFLIDQYKGDKKIILREKIIELVKHILVLFAVRLSVALLSEFSLVIFLKTHSILYKIISTYSFIIIGNLSFELVGIVMNSLRKLKNKENLKPVNS